MIVAVLVLLFDAEMQCCYHLFQVTLCVKPLQNVSFAIGNKLPTSTKRPLVVSKHTTSDEDAIHNCVLNH